MYHTLRYEYVEGDFKWSHNSQYMVYAHLCFCVMISLFLIVVLKPEDENRMISFN